MLIVLCLVKKAKTMTDFEKINLTTTPLSEDRLEALKTLVPEAFITGELDTATLLTLLGLGDTEQPTKKEGYGLTWAGKREAQQQAGKGTRWTLIPAEEESVDWHNTQNLLIEADNLVALKLLKQGYAGKVDMIYIDPPYNADADTVYNDNFSEDRTLYEIRSGHRTQEGNLLDTYQDKGHKHSQWLSMMVPRLQLMKQLLKQGGVIFVSIDDTEIANLRLLMDEIFGEDNIVGVFKRKASRKPTFLGKMSDVCDYILCYALGDLEQCLSNETVKDLTRPVLNDSNEYSLKTIRGGTEARCQDGSYPRGSYKVKSSEFELLQDLEVLNGLTTKDCQVKAKWRVNQEILHNSLYITKNFGFRRYVLPEELEKRKALHDVIVDEKFVNENGSEELNALFLKESLFQNPKPTNLISYLLNSVYQNEKNIIILDCFAGSGTTGHAVMKLNAEDGGQRQYICVQIPEKLDPKNKNQPTACEFLDSINKPRTIAEITKERLRRAGASIKEAHPESPVDVGFKVFKLADSTIAPKQATYTHRTDFENEARTLTTQNQARLRYALQTDPYAIAWEVALKQGYALTEQLVPVSLGTLTGYAIYPPKPTERHALHQPKLLVLPQGVLEDKDAVWAFTHALQTAFPTHHFVLWEGLFQGDDAVKRSVMDAVDTFKTQLTDLKGNPLKNNTLRIEVIRL